MYMEQQLAQGIDNMRQIVGDETYELLQSSTPMKLFFSMLSPTPLDAGKNVANAVTSRFQDTAVVGTNGFIYGDNIYPFTSEYQTMIHRKMIASLIKNPRLTQDVVGSFVTFSSEWKELFTSLQRERLDAKLVKIHKDRVDKLMVETTSKFDMNTDIVTKKNYFASTYPSLSEVEVNALIKDIGAYSKARCLVYRTETSYQSIVRKYAGIMKDIQDASDKRVAVPKKEMKAIDDKYNIQIDEAVGDKIILMDDIKLKHRQALALRLDQIPINVSDSVRKEIKKREQKRCNNAIKADCKPYSGIVTKETKRFKDLIRKEQAPYKAIVKNEKDRCEEELKSQRVLKAIELTNQKIAVQKVIDAGEAVFSANMLAKYDISIKYGEIEPGLRRYRNQHLKDYLVEKGYITDEQFSEYTSFSKQLNEILEQLDKLSIQKVIETNTRVINISNDCKKYQLVPVVSRDQCSSIVTIRLALNSIQTCLKIAAGIKYFDSYKGERIYRLEYNAFFPIIEEVYDRETMQFLADQLESKVEHLRKLMSILLRETNQYDVERLLINYIGICNHYYNDLYIPYQHGKLIYGGITARERGRIRAYINDAAIQLESKRGSVVDVEVEKRFDALMNTICKRLLGVEKSESSNIIMLPTGFILVDTNKGIAAQGFHPLDLEVKDIMDQVTWKDWVKSWEQFWKKISKPDYRGKFEFIDETIRDIVNGQVDEMMNSGSELTPVETRSKELQDIYSFKTSPLLRKTGLFNYSINEFNLQLLEEVLPLFSRYIGSVVLGDFSADPKELPEKVQRFVINGTDYISILIRQGNSLTLNISSGMSTSEVSPDALAHIIGIKLYQMMPPEVKRNFHDIVINKLTVSKMDLFRVTEIRIDSPLERRQCMSRFLFVSEFVKYISNAEIEPEMDNFFRNKIDTLILKV